MGDRELAAMTSSPAFGSLALTEISKRERMRLMSAAQQQGQAAGTGETLADKKIASLAQQKFADKLANDERMGLNNIVAQAEQGGLEFGSPYGETAEMAGGGMVAFDRGGQVPGFAIGALIPAALAGARALGPLAMRGMSGLRGLAARYPKTTAGLGVASGIPFGLGALGGDDEEELQKQYEAQNMQEGYESQYRDPRASGGKGDGRDIDRDVTGGAAKRQALELEQDPRKILEQMRALEKEQGLGEYGAEAKRIREGRKSRVEETLGRALESEPYLAGAEAAGQVRPTGRRGLAGLLDVLAPSVAAMGKSAAGIQRQKTDALDKLAEGEERLALAQEQYARGNIKDATTQANQAKKDMFNADIQLRGLDLKEKYYDALGLAAKAKAAGGAGFKLGDVTRATTAINDLQNQLRMLDPKKDKAAIAETQRLIQVLKGGIGMAYARGTGASIQDTED